MAKKTAGRPDPQLERIRAAGKAQAVTRTIDWAGRTLLAIVIVIGITQAQPIFDDLAGKDTNVNVIGQLGWGGTVVAGTGWANERRRRRLAEKSTIKAGMNQLPSAMPESAEEAS